MKRGQTFARPQEAKQAKRCTKLRRARFGHLFWAGKRQRKNVALRSSTGFAPLIHSFSTPGFLLAAAPWRSASPRRIVYAETHALMGSRRTILAVLLSLCVASASAAQSSAQLYRVFLKDGSALASFGEWARVDDRVVFSMPLAPGAGPGELHLVSLPLSRIDLERTEQYADAVRAANYAATRGEADFAQLSSTVAHTLNQVALIKDPRQRLAAAEQARRELTDWPGNRFGYRAAEVREIVGVLDEVIGGLRASADGKSFELALSANTEIPPPAALLPAPTHEDIVQHLMTASQLVDSPAEKVSLLQSVVALIDRAVGYLPNAISAALRETALGGIAEEQRIDNLYTDLQTTTLAEAGQFAERADVRSLERLREQVQQRDAQLGARRPDHVAGLLATLDAQLDSARQLRLAHDQWLLAETHMRRYQSRAMPFIQSLVNMRQSLDDIKLLAGPAPQRLRPLSRRLDRNARQLALLEPPTPLSAVHAAFRSAYTLAINAVQLRRDAVEVADLELARQASAAASGALMLLERARVDLRAALESPLRQRAATRQ